MAGVLGPGVSVGSTPGVPWRGDSGCERNRVDYDSAMRRTAPLSGKTDKAENMAPGEKIQMQLTRRSGTLSSYPGLGQGL